MTTVSEQQQRTCAKHGAYRANVINILGREIVTQCPECQGAEKARNQALEQRSRDEARVRRTEMLQKLSGVPKRFQNRSFSNYETTQDGQSRALRIAQTYAEQWPEMQERGTCLIFSGNAGTGKTHLACAIAHSVIQQGSSVLFTTVSDALRLIKRAYEKGSGVSELDAINALVEPRLLILDEVGMDYGTDHAKTLIFDLMNKRYENMRPTILLTNLDAPALREHLGDRITDRLREGGGKFVSFSWASHRA